MEIKYKSAPNHANFLWDSPRACTEWVMWHSQLMSWYGKEEADRIWVKGYDKRGDGSYEKIDCAVKNEEFKKYVTENGLAAKSDILQEIYRAKNISEGRPKSSVNNVPDPFQDTHSAIGSVADGIKGAGDGIKGAGKGVSVLGKSIPYVVVGVIGIGLLGLGYWMYNFSGKGQIPMNQADLLMKGLTK